VGWYWHFVEAGLRERGHEVVAPDLPCDDDLADLRDYADTVVDAIGDRSDLVVVGQSYGGFTAPLVADRLQAQALVLVAGMIPVAGEAPADWWDSTVIDRPSRSKPSETAVRRAATIPSSPSTRTYPALLPARG
jgi:pimeloyl-ACP methyl ester carboxylesterase